MTERRLRRSAWLVAALLILAALWRWGEEHQAAVDPDEQRGIDYINDYGR